MVTGIMTEEPPDGLEKLGWMGQGVVDVDVLGICFTSLEQVSVGDYIPNCWVMFNKDIYQPLRIAIKKMKIYQSWDIQKTQSSDGCWVDSPFLSFKGYNADV